jgi:hypothetical protein
MARPSLLRPFVQPFVDVLRGLDRCLELGVRGLILTATGLLAGWWIYVPAHELLHAGACRAAGGQVIRLEIDNLYFGGLLARLFPFVVPASDYAGRLAGFDTRGSDWIYLATDLGPFLLTLMPGVWALRRAARAGNAPLFGAAIPFALAPFLSLSGDAYEIGSILATRLPPWSGPSARQLLRGDDLLRRLEMLAAAPDAPWGGAVLAIVFGVLWAFLTYGLASLVARALGAPAPTLPDGPSPSREHPGLSPGHRPNRRRSGP